MSPPEHDGGDTDTLPGVSDPNCLYCVDITPSTPPPPTPLPRPPPSPKPPLEVAYQYQETSSHYGVDATGPWRMAVVALACLLLVLLIIFALHLMRSAKGRCEVRRCKAPEEKGAVPVVPINVVHSYDEEAVVNVSFTNEKLLALPRYV